MSSMNMRAGFSALTLTAVGGANDQLVVSKETITFMAAGTFSSNAEVDDEITRHIGNDPGTGNNTFTTTYSQNPEIGSGTYSVSADGVVTITFTGEDGGQGTAALSADGRTVIFGYGVFDDIEEYASLGFCVGVKQATIQRFISPGAMFLLLSQ